jgi:gliding motility-associated-like protein
MRCLFFFVLLLMSVSASAQLNADFSAVSTQGCSPLTVQFQDNSTGSPTQWFWDFGNGITSFSQNPTVVYTNSGSYTVRLIVRNSAGENYKEKTNYITVFATPSPNFLVLAGDSGCVSLQATFKDTTNFFGAPVQSWLWNFGDGTTSSLQSPTHTFNTEGKYSVSLSVATTQGCSATITKNNAIKAGNRPTANFSATPLSGCASLIRYFQNTSTGNITSYFWNFGDSIGTSNELSPQYHYQDTGIFSVKLIVSENGCKDSITIPDYMQVTGPVANFITLINCHDRFKITFSDRSIGLHSRLWDFGDGTTSTATSPSHVYATPGAYTINLKITGGSCKDTARNTVHVSNYAMLALQVSPVKSAYCKYDSLKFITSNYDTADVKLFFWRFGDSTTGSSRNNSIIHLYRKTGNFIPTGYIRDLEGCTDTANFNGTVVINGPTASISADTTGCTNAPTVLIDSSVPLGAPITQWFWNFDDGITSDTGSTQSHNYPFPGTYHVGLKVTDGNACSDSTTDSINVYIPPVVDAGIDTFACAGSDVTLNPTGASTYIWQRNPDLSCTFCANPVAVPFQSTTYYVSGISNGCATSDSVNVKVQQKQIIQAQPNSYAICEGDSVTLAASGTDIYTWSPANTLSNPSINNPVAFPSVSTTYTVTGKDNKNCFSDTAAVTVHINPNPVVNIIDSSVRLIKGSIFYIAVSASSDAQKFEWSPGTGLSCYDCLQPTASINNTITYTLDATNQFGCVDSDHITFISICTGEAVYMPNTFSPNNDGMNDYFFPRSTSDIPIKSLTIFNRWGQMIFQKTNFPSNNYTYGWDGKYKNVLQNPDVYIYVMELQCSGNSTAIKKGDITLLR